MEETTSSASVSATEAQISSDAQKKDDVVKKIGTTTERSEADHRQAYGTAKTENLRDSGLWRILLPTIVVLFCIVLLAVPLLILIPLLSNSVIALQSGGNPKEAQLLWVWIVMIVLELGITAVIVRGLTRIFMTQAGNYHRL